MFELTQGMEDIRQLILRVGSLENYKTWQYIQDVLIPSLKEMETELEDIRNRIDGLEYTWMNRIEEWESSEPMVHPEQKAIL